MLNRFHNWLLNWKPIHLCWWFELHGWKIPKYFIGRGDVPHAYQIGYKIGNNDSSDPDNCTFDSLDTPRTNQAKETAFMVRVQAAMLNSDAPTGAYWLHYNDEDTVIGSVQVGAALDGTVQVDSFDGLPGDNAAVNNQYIVKDWYGAGIYEWIDGKYDDVDGGVIKITLAEGIWTDLQFCVQFTADAQYDKDYYFFLMRGVASFYSYDKVPQVRTAVFVPDPARVGETELCDIVINEGGNITGTVTNEIKLNSELTNQPKIEGTITNVTKLSLEDDDSGEGIFGITNQPAIEGTTTKPKCIN